MGRNSIQFTHSKPWPSSPPHRCWQGSPWNKHQYESRNPSELSYSQCRRGVNSLDEVLLLRALGVDRWGVGLLDLLSAAHREVGATEGSREGGNCELEYQSTSAPICQLSHFLSNPFQWQSITTLSRPKEICLLPKTIPFLLGLLGTTYPVGANLATSDVVHGRHLDGI